MKINSNKGFVLAETLIVTVFLMVILTMLYSYFYPLIGEFEKRETYDDVDGKYSIYWLKKLIEDDDYKFQVTPEEIENYDSKYFVRFKCDDIAESNKRAMCISLVKSMEIEGCDTKGNLCEIYITKYRIGGTSGKWIKDTVRNGSGTLSEPKPYKKYEEECRLSKTECINKYVTKCTNGGGNSTNCQENAEKNIFRTGLKDYILSLPDYSSGSLNYAGYRVIASFHKKNHNNNYYTYATIEVNKRPAAEIETAAPGATAPEASYTFKLNFDLNGGRSRSGCPIPNETTEHSIGEELAICRPEQDDMVFGGWMSSSSDAKYGMTHAEENFGSYNHCGSQPYETCKFKFIGENETTVTLTAQWRNPIFYMDTVVPNTGPSGITNGEADINGKLGNAVVAIAPGGTITFIRDESHYENLTIEKNMTINTTGKRVTVGGQEFGVVGAHTYTNLDGTLTVKSGVTLNIIGDGKLILKQVIIEPGATVNATITPIGDRYHITKK